MASPLAKRLAGVYIADSARPLPSTVAWAQDECRSGSLRSLLDRFAARQPEPLDMSLILVEKIEGDGILAKVPCKMRDRESTHPFATEVWLKINPLLREIVRLESSV
jgi:hypothetical protein